MALNIFECYELPCGALRQRHTDTNADSEEDNIRLCPEVLVVHVDDHIPPMFPISRRFFWNSGTALVSTVQQHRLEHGTEILEAIELEPEEGVKKPRYLLLVHIPVRGFSFYRNKGAAVADWAMTKSDIKVFYKMVLHWADEHQIRSIGMPLMTEWCLTLEETEAYTVSVINAYLERYQSFLNVYLFVPPVEYSQNEVDFADRWANYEEQLKRQQIRSGLSEQAYIKQRREYYLFERMGKPSALAALIDYDKANLTKLRSGDVWAPFRKNAVKLAIGMGLSALERYELMTYVFGHQDYPSQPFEFAVERLLPDECMDFARVNHALYKEDPSFAFREPLLEEIAMFQRSDEREFE